MDEIKELLARKMMEEDNEELASRFYNVGMDFLLNERCWWCKPEVKEISKEMMYVFSLELNEGDATDKVFRFKRKMEDNLKTCGGCITEYVIGKRELREK
ncbi:hypothetical protein AX774_g2636 [Zancudomyces culisetae]|uniref:Uncharacterized protein n=1 Tax=Zancudomyces culisetae TaxID=1213189 RepID=A0A1R1PS96_ZANCU|nr:hypothetical protein AX774_g2636 [Zancudomyces culisetae]|eukprot:OMH83855.1 hypothetical protein AX774_g2636 [Zancudomyces culisetae]